MVATTLIDLSTHIDALASDDGTFVVVCARTGDRPVPVTGARFEQRSVARRAARAAEQYRAALRRYDPQVPHCELIVCQDTGAAVGQDATRRDADAAEAPPTGVACRERVEFCHRVAAALFESLADRGHTGVEQAVLDAYLTLAETVTDPNECCLCLLERMASELADRLSATEQAALIADAARRVGSQRTARPVRAALDVLEDRGVVRGVTGVVGAQAVGRPVEIALQAYALAPTDGRLPVLPIAVEWSRHGPDPPTAIRVVGAGTGWKLTIDHSKTAERTGLASVPIGMR
ncbi:MAG: DUF7551 domain-containing protein [Halococcoides sp.]